MVVPGFKLARAPAIHDDDLTPSQVVKSFAELLGPCLDAPSPQSMACLDPVSSQRVQSLQNKLCIP